MNIRHKSLLSFPALPPVAAHPPTVPALDRWYTQTQPAAGSRPEYCLHSTVNPVRVSWLRTDASL